MTELSRSYAQVITALEDCVAHLERLGVDRASAIQAVAVEHGIAAQKIRALLGFDDSRMTARE